MTVQRRRRDESGIALLVVLLAITLLTIVVVEFTEYAQVETHLALSGRNALQATYLARSGVNVAEALVSVDGLISPGSDGVEDFWARPYPPVPIGDGTATFRVRDEARFLNLNDMRLENGYVDPKRLDVFARLFVILGVEKRILYAIADWIDIDQAPRVDPPGAEQPYYLGLRPPTFVRNGPLLTLRELLLIRGMTPTVLARLESFVTVLPPGRLKVNVNTAPAEVLYALDEVTFNDRGVVERLLATRQSAQFRDLNELKVVTGIPASLTTNDGFADTKSGYFRLEGVGEIDEVRRGIVEVVQRDGRRVKRITWTPTSAHLTLTSLPPSDLLATLPVFGDR